MLKRLTYLFLLAFTALNMVAIDMPQPQCFPCEGPDAPPPARMN
jgi:hypothetical protein